MRGLSDMPDRDQATEMDSDFAKGVASQKEAFAAMLEEMIANRKRQAAELALKLGKTNAEIGDLQKLLAAQAEHD